MNNCSLISPNKFVLKLNIHCKRCEKRLKFHLENIQGVHSVEVDSKQGNVIITGTVPSSTIISLLEKFGRKPELLWEQNPTAKSCNINKDMQIISKSEVFNELNNDPEMVEELRKLSRVKGLDGIKVTCSKTIELVFEKKNGFSGDKNVEIRVKENVLKDSPRRKKGEETSMKNDNFACNSPRRKKGEETSMKNDNFACNSHPCFGGHATHSIASSPCYYCNWHCPLPGGSNGAGGSCSPPPQWSYWAQSPPPPPRGVFVPPGFGSPYVGTFSDENATSCKIM